MTAHAADPARVTIVAGYPVDLYLVSGDGEGHVLRISHVSEPVALAPGASTVVHLPKQAPGMRNVTIDGRRHAGGIIVRNT